MKILIADKFESEGIDRFRALGCDVVSQPDLTPTDLPASMRDHDPGLLIVRSTKVTKEAISEGESLTAIVRAGAGYDTIDVVAASDHGVFVANCPGKNSTAVAELTWGLILSCDRRIPDQTADLRAGRWNKKEYAKAIGLRGRTLGIIGLGQIGREVALRGRAFGMSVIAWSRSLTPQAAVASDVGHRERAIDVAHEADIICIHCAATDATHHLIDADFCAALKPGAILINTARGSLVDQAALANAIRTKGVRAGLDVFTTEPAPGDVAFHDSIVNEPGVYGTHHVGASTDQAQQAIACEAVRIVEHYLRTGKMINCVNQAESTPASYILTIRMLNKPGVLAHVFYVLGQAGINVEEMDNVIYEGAKAACAHIQLDEPAPADLLAAMRANRHILSSTCAAL